MLCEHLFRSLLPAVVGFFAYLYVTTEHDRTLIRDSVEKEGQNASL